MDKLNPQPEPPGEILNLFGWIWYVLQYVFWALLYPVRYFL